MSVGETLHKDGVDDFVFGGDFGFAWPLFREPPLSLFEGFLEFVGADEDELGGGGSLFRDCDETRQIVVNGGGTNAEHKAELLGVVGVFDTKKESPGSEKTTVHTSGWAGRKSSKTVSAFWRPNSGIYPVLCRRKHAAGLQRVCQPKRRQRQRAQRQRAQRLPVGHEHRLAGQQNQRRLCKQFCAFRVGREVFTECRVGCEHQFLAAHKLGGRVQSEQKPERRQIRVSTKVENRRTCCAETFWTGRLFRRKRVLQQDRRKRLWPFDWCRDQSLRSVHRRTRRFFVFDRSDGRQKRRQNRRCFRSIAGVSRELRFLCLHETPKLRSPNASFVFTFGDPFILFTLLPFNIFTILVVL